MKELLRILGSQIATKPLGLLPSLYGLAITGAKGIEALTNSKYRPSDWLEDNLYEGASFITGRRGRRSFDQVTVDKAKTRQCAAWSNSDLRNKGYKISGSAWNLSDVKPVVSGYEKNKPKTNDYQTLQKYNWDAADNLKRKFTPKQLDPNKIYVVNLYSTGSPYQRESFNKGTSGYGSHTGQLRNNNGKWYLYHNWHGDVKKTSIDNVLGSKNEIGITEIFVPLKKIGGYEQNSFNTFINSFKH